MMNLTICSFNKFLQRTVLLRSFSASALPENTSDKHKQISKNVLEDKLKETSFIKDNFVNLSKRWKEKHELYYGKERDLANYPVQKIPETHPKVRMGLLPDDWFNALYPKTGVTGPYLLFWGGVAFLFQKEIWVADGHFYEVPGAILGIIVLQKVLGPFMSKYYQKRYEKKEWYITKRRQNVWKQMAEKSIALAKEDKETVDVSLDLFQATKENIGLQLEVAYRNRFVELHKAVKSRLDYQVEKELSKQRFQRNYMLNWIVDSVVKDFTPQQEKATINQCISDLRSLATKLKTVNV